MKLTSIIYNMSFSDTVLYIGQPNTVLYIGRAKKWVKIAVFYFFFADILFSHKMITESKKSPKFTNSKTFRELMG